MKKIVFGGATLVMGAAALRRFGPKLEERAMRKCGEMFSRMNEGSPPKKMLRRTEQVRDLEHAQAH